MPDPRVSVVVPTYNAGPFLAPALDSVLAQSYRDWECIVVDDASTDASFDVAQSYEQKDSRFRAIRVPHGDVAKARNAGFRLGSDKAAYVTFMDQDDVWLPSAFETLLRAAERDPEALGAHGVAEFIGVDGEVGTGFAERGRTRVRIDGKRLVVAPLDMPTDFSFFIVQTPVYPPGLILVKRDAYLDAGPFDESNPPIADWEMLTRLTRRGHLAFIPEVILHYRQHGKNASQQSTIPERVHLAYCAVFYSPLNSHHQQLMAIRGWRAMQRDAMKERWAAARQAGPSKVGASHLARLGVSFGRYLRGSPRPIVKQQALPWSAGY